MNLNEAKSQEQLTRNISRKSRFEVGIIRVREVCHHWRSTEKGLLWGRRTKKMKKVLDEVSENYHKGIKSQILQGLEPGRDATTTEIVARVDGARQKVNAELSALVKAGKIEKVKRGVYRWSPDSSLIDEAEDAPLIIIFY